MSFILRPCRPTGLQVVLLALLGVSALGQGLDSNTLLHETFSDGQAALERWEFKGDANAKLALVQDEKAKKSAVYVDFRERASWRLLGKEPIALQAGAQYTLSAAVRRNLGYGGMRLVAQVESATGGEDSHRAGDGGIAEVEVMKRLNERHEVSVIFVAKADAPV
ncbi:MAG: hypothetical protein FJ279_37775, partial [Planctomycetes bacterium]|nr:hypothetical protein [Planctomycetota bacterium]